MNIMFKEAKVAKRWGDERKCYLDPQGNPVTDPNTVDFAELLTTIPTTAKLYSKKKGEFVKMIVQETTDESQERMAENQKKKSDKTEVKTQTESPESLNQVKSMDKNDENDKQSKNRNEEQCRKCMQSCSACTEKDEMLKSRDAEFTKIENVFKEKCKEFLERKIF
ncbi:hypothetical protein Hanom_Chr00s000001g01598221 [Helianthus anomalus]